MPNSRTPGIPRSAVSRASLTSSSMEVCATPGMEVSGLRTPEPGTTNSGRIRLDTSTRVSRTSARMRSVRRSLRGRYSGNDDISMHSHIHELEALTVTVTVTVTLTVTLTLTLAAG